MLEGTLKEAFDQIVAPGTVMAAMGHAETGETFPAFVVKMDRGMLADAPDLRYDITAVLRPQLGIYPAGAVLRFAVGVTLTSGVGYTFDSFSNPSSEADRDLLTAWTIADRYVIAFYDAAGKEVASKMVRLRPATRREIAGLISRGRTHNTECARFDYAAALEQFRTDTA